MASLLGHVRRQIRRPLQFLLRRLRQHSDKGGSPLLILLARLKRSTLTKTTFIGITGSCGKSTTVAVAHAILSPAGKCVLGIDRSITLAPDTVFRTDKSIRFSILETHASSKGVIAKSLRVFRPQIGVVTTIGDDHYSCYRSREATAEEKGKLIECLPETGVAVLNIDDPNVAGMAKRTRARVLTYGESVDAELRATEVSSIWPGRLSMRVTYRGETVQIVTKLAGRHWTTSVLAGIGAGLACGVDFKTCAERATAAEPVFGRYTIHRREDGAAYVLDSHKAPFWTVAEGFAFVRGIAAPRKTIVFGTISDYPGAAGPRYRRLAREALEIADRVIVVGPHASHIDKLQKGDLKQRLFGFQTTYQACTFLNDDEVAGELIYVKASVAQHLERIMLSRIDKVVCWHERCGRKRPCVNCTRRFVPRDPPLGLIKPSDPAVRMSRREGLPQS